MFFTGLQNVSLNQDIFPCWEVIFPFTISENNDDLEKYILGFDENSYHEVLDNFLEDMELVFDGNASERISDVILEKLAVS